MSTALTVSTKFLKHPDESLLYAIDFEPLLGDGETLDDDPVAPTVVASIEKDDQNVDSGTPALTIASVAVSGTKIVFRCSAGSAEVDYRLQVQTDTSESNTRVVDAIVQVRDK